MHYFRFFTVMVIVTVISSTSFGRTPLAENTNPNKALVVDGHVVHNLGNLASNVTNFGLIGSMPSAPSPFSDAPSAMWPAGSGDEYLWGAGLWVGGIVLGESLVSTAFYHGEIMPTTAAGDTIYSTFQGAPGGTRYPWAGADDDGDGLEDEDPLDGLDNDGDGLVDEDFAAISGQEFRCTMSDYSSLAIQDNPEHTPLNIGVTQRSFQWGDPLAADFIGYEYTIKNEGVVGIEEVHCGLFSDFDIGPRGLSIAEDDLAGSYNGQVITSDGTFVTVSMGYMRDGAETNGIPGWVGWVMCGLETDALAGLSDDPLSLPSMQIYSGSAPFEQGGDPTNDSQRYEVMSMGQWDADIPSNRADDYRIVISSQALPVLDPSESLTFRVALVLGEDFPDMLLNASEAVLIATGKYYDRDGDPANGDEFHVPWLRSEEGLTAVMPAPLQKTVLHEAIPNPFNPRTTIAFDLPREAKVNLRVYDMAGRLVDVLLDNEMAVRGMNKIIWNGDDMNGQQVSAGVYFYTLNTATFQETKRMTLLK